MQRQWLVKHIGENPYLQYFIGMKEYGSCPFGASTLVAFRKRFSEKDLAAILEASVPKAEAQEKDDSDNGNNPPNRGTLVLDAICCPADIAYPQDIDLLNQAREKAEKTVDELCELTEQKKPRMSRKRARKDYLRLSKSKKRSAKAIRSAVRKPLQYIRRDMGYVAELVQKGAKLSSKQAERLNVVTTVYEQQRIMFESGTHSIPRRIVSPAQPWASSPRIRSCPIKQRNRSIRTDATAMLWRVFSGRARPLMVWPRITARLQKTTFCVIGVALLLLNLFKSLRTALALFCLLSMVAFFRGCGVGPS